MEYSAPNESDLANVKALNAAFLNDLCEGSAAIELRDEQGPALREVFMALNAVQRTRLGSAPFLLFSLREHEAQFWDDCLAAGQEQRTRDMFSVNRLPDDENPRLPAAALAFLWQLAGRNPYAARLVSGASVDWCERLADCTLVSLLSRVSTRREFLQLRFAGNRPVLNKLLGAGVSSQAEVRHAAHMAAMQAMLLQVASPMRTAFRAAACKLPPAKRR
jgi:hypothetical protein